MMCGLLLPENTRVNAPGAAGTRQSCGAAWEHPRLGPSARGPGGVYQPELPAGRIGRSSSTNAQGHRVLSLTLLPFVDGGADE
jgi:hypothetical protein